jgi:hypothetical protein
MILLILKILGITCLVLTGILLLMLFIQLKVRLKGEFQDSHASGEIELYWIKYLFDLRCKVENTDHLRFILRFFFIPISFRLPLKHETVTRPPREEKKEDVPTPRYEKEFTSDIQSERPPLRDRFEDLLDIKDRIRGAWKTFYPDIKKIYVRYITFSCESLNAKIGFPEPSQTAMVAGMSYSIMPLSPFRTADIQWDFENPGVALAARIKITMKLYGILCKLLHLYWIYKKGKNNEIE